MKKTFGTLLILFSIAIFGQVVHKTIIFKQNVTGFLKRAADANTIDLAQGELDKAINYLEANHLTTGYTSILWQTPDEDIDFWYRNLVASRDELISLKTDSPLERTNVLIKLRETLLDHGKKLKVTVPRGLSVYPNNGAYALGMSCGIVAGLTGLVMITYNEEEEKKHRT